jgi:site-specific DNA recombinase
MKRRGLRTKETSRVPNAPVTEHGLQAILKNPFYTGRFRWSGQVWEGKYPPLISKKLFDRVRVQLERNCSNPKAGAKKSFLFSPFLRCGLCRHSMSAETHHGLTYYRCNHTQDKNCKQGFFREERVDELFAEALGTLYVDDSIASKIKEHLRSSNLEKEDESARERKRLSSRLTQMDDRLSMAYQDRLDGHISLERYKEVEMGIQEEMSQVQADLSRLGVRNLQYKSEGSQVLELVRGFKETYLRADREGKAQILRIVLHRCYIRGDKGEDSYFEFHEPFNTLFAMGKILKERRAHPFEKRSLKGE